MERTIRIITPHVHVYLYLHTHTYLYIINVPIHIYLYIIYVPIHIHIFKVGLPTWCSSNERGCIPLGVCVRLRNNQPYLQIQNTFPNTILHNVCLRK